MSEPGRVKEHPSPHRGRVGTVALLLGLAIGPAAWALQQMLGYGVSARACFPSDAPSTATPGGWGAVLATVAACGLAPFLVALGGVGIALRAWRATRQEKDGAREALLEIGEGRSRFLALCGVLAGSLFCLAIVFDLAVTFSLRTCGTLAP